MEENQSTANLLRVGSLTFQHVEFETINQLHKHKDFIYVEAKNQLEKDEWEAKISGIEKVVTVSRKAPEVRLIPERKGHNFERLHF